MTPARSSSRSRLESSPRDRPGAGGDLVEGLTADEDVAEDDDRPALAQELRRPSDRAVLPVGPHATACHPDAAGTSSVSEPLVAGPASAFAGEQATCPGNRPAGSCRVLVPVTEHRDIGNGSTKGRARGDAMSTSEYLLAGQVSELERLKLQSRVWEPSGRRLLGRDRRRSRCPSRRHRLRRAGLAAACSASGLDPTARWWGPTSTMPCLPSPIEFVAEAESRKRQAREGRPVRHQPGARFVRLVHARYEITPLGRGPSR